jgi:hypothetical protein
MRTFVVLGALAAGALALGVGARDARACGGCFHGPSMSGTVITDHRMIFRVSANPPQTTLYDEIEYQGNPQSFAWVLPIHGQVQVGLSSDVVFAALEQATQTSIQAPPPPSCPSCSCGDFGGGSSSGSGSGGGAPGAAEDAGVTVIGQQTVGPYDTVQLQSSDPMALNNWLTANGFVIPGDIQPIIAAYVNEGFDFLALRLAPGQSVQAMRPVRVTTNGTGLSLPLRMVSAGTGNTVGITLWVVADGRYEPANFQQFTISPSELTWDWSKSSSDYATIRQNKEMALNFAAWQIESSLDVSPYQVEGPVLSGPADMNYLPVPAADGGASDGGAGETADQVRQDDLSTLFPGTNQGTVRITRMRGDLSHAALATDLVLQASSDQSTLSNIYPVTKQVNAPQCPPVPNPCPPCGGSSSGTTSSSSGGASSGGPFGSSGGETTKPSTPGQQSFSCAATTSEPGGAPWFELAVAGFLGLAIVRARSKRR